MSTRSLLFLFSLDCVVHGTVYWLSFDLILGYSAFDNDISMSTKD
jgi:hypothetical protein